MAASHAIEPDRLTLVELMQQYGSEDACHEALEELRWPDGVACPKCGDTAISRIKKRRQYDCGGCRHQFSVRVGTIFHDSKLPLWKWFLCVYMMCESKKGISANQIKRMLGVSYKTAWYLCHRVRAAMREDSPAPLTGEVEIDETYVGGKNTGKGREMRLENKVHVAGAVERGGRVRMAVVPSFAGGTLRRFYGEVISDSASEIYSDSAAWNNGALGDENTRHRTVNHSKFQWVLPDDVHTNTIEGVWALLKRSIAGSYHKLSEKHLQAYLDEMTWRYNNRENAYLFRDTMLELLKAERVEYKDLISRR
jgi:transposase-like protein